MTLLAVPRRFPRTTAVVVSVVSFGLFVILRFRLLPAAPPLVTGCALGSVAGATLSALLPDTTWRAIALWGTAAFWVFLLGAAAFEGMWGAAFWPPLFEGAAILGSAALGALTIRAVIRARPMSEVDSVR